MACTDGGRKLGCSAESISMTRSVPVAAQFSGSRHRLSQLVSKMALHRAGYGLVHLSRSEHGYSSTIFGMRCLNPLRSRIESRYLAERVVIGEIAPESDADAHATTGRERNRLDHSGGEGQQNVQRAIPARQASGRHRRTQSHAEYRRQPLARRHRSRTAGPYRHHHRGAAKGDVGRRARSDDACRIWWRD